jgi:hypothetical protein
MSFPLHHLVLEAFAAVGAWENINHVEKSLTLPELIYIVDMVRSLRHQDYDFTAQVHTGESIGGYRSMTDLDTETASGSSADLDLDSEFIITHLPIGLGYESDDVG